MLGEAFTIHFETTSQNLQRGTDDGLLYEYRVSELTFESGTSRLRFRNEEDAPVLALRMLRDQTYSEIGSSCLSAVNHNRFRVRPLSSGSHVKVKQLQAVVVKGLHCSHFLTAMCSE
jgi:hypothetical protein